MQPDGTSSTISHLTVGGRTSAIVDSVQVLPADHRDFAVRKKRKAVPAASDEVPNRPDGAPSSLPAEAGSTPKKRSRVAVAVRAALTAHHFLVAGALTIVA